MDFIKGMDISMLPELEELGVHYYNEGKEQDLFALLKEKGVNMLRFRLWNHPYDENQESYGGGTNDLEKLISLAIRAKEQGIPYILDFHYSDFWTDPKKQIKPKEWKLFGLEELQKAVYEYTLHTLQLLKERGLLPKMVQVGNEITNGFLWPEGQIACYRYCEIEQENRDYTNLFSLLKEGIRAVRECDETIQIILHLDYGGDNGLYREWFDKAKEARLDYDIIGLSYYPYWHGSLSDLENNLQDISKRYQKDVLIVETAYGFTVEEKENCVLIFNNELAQSAGYPPTPKGQGEFLHDLAACIKSIEDNRGIGFVYWEPAWLPIKGSTWGAKEGQIYMSDEAPEGNSWANQALFDYDGNALPAWEIIKDM